MYDADDAGDLRSLFQRAFLGEMRVESDDDLAPLRTMVCAYVREARAQGDPPERVLAALKHVTINSVEALYPRQELPEQRVLRETLFRWFLDEYYAPDRPRGPDAPGVDT